MSISNTQLLQIVEFALKLASDVEQLTYSYASTDTQCFNEQELRIIDTLELMQKSLTAEIEQQQQEKIQKKAKNEYWQSYIDKYKAANPDSA